MSEKKIVVPVLAYDEQARIHHGEFAYLNFPDRMFLAPDGPEIPEAINDLVFRGKVIAPADETETVEECDRRILEAYRRGKESK